MTFFVRIQELSFYSDTGNIAFDSIINYKLKNAREENIKTDIRLTLPPAINIDLADAAIILGNLLDNALDAAAKVPEKEISLDIEYSRQTLFIHEKNTFDGIVAYSNESGTAEKRIAAGIASRKSGGGLGLKNIRRAIAKYNGHMEITRDGYAVCKTPTILNLSLFMPFSLLGFFQI